jgi:hypothetical protein
MMLHLAFQIEGQPVYESGHIFLKCFQFTFEQLRVEREANTLRVKETRFRARCAYA